MYEYEMQSENEWEREKIEELIIHLAALLLRNIHTCKEMISLPGIFILAVIMTSTYISDT